MNFKSNLIKVALSALLALIVTWALLQLPRTLRLELLPSTLGTELAVWIESTDKSRSRIDYNLMPPISADLGYVSSFVTLATGDDSTFFVEVSRYRKNLIKRLSFQTLLLTWQLDPKQALLIAQATEADTEPATLRLTQEARALFSRVAVVRFAEALTIGVLVALICSLISMSAVVSKSGPLSRHGYWLLPLAIVGVGFSPVLSGSITYLFLDIGADTHHAYWSALLMWHDKLREYGFPFWPFWSFRFGIGTEIGPYLAEPLSIPFLVVPEAYIPAVFGWMAAIKMTAVALLMRVLLLRLSIHNSVAILGSVLFATSGFIAVWGQHPQYGSVALYFVLALLGLESWLRLGRYLLLVASLACLSLVHVYYLLTTLIFLSLLSLVRFSQRCEVPNSKMQKMLGLGMAGALALGITAYSAIPAIAVALGSARTTTVVASQLPLIDVSSQSILTVFGRWLSNDLLGIANAFRGQGNYYEAPGGYAGILSVILMFQFFAVVPRFLKVSLGGLWGLYFVAQVSPYLRNILGLFSGPSFRERSLFLAHLTVIAGAYALHCIVNTGKTNRKALFASIFFVITVLFLGHIVPTGARLVPFFDWRLSLVIILFTASYSILMLSLRSNALILALIAISSLEATIALRQTITERTIVTDRTMLFHEGFYDGTRDAISRYTPVGEPARTERLFRSSFTTDAVAQRFFGTNSYFSFNHRGYRRLLTFLGISHDTHYIGNGIESRPLFDLLGVRYLLGRASDAAPVATHVVGSDSRFILYENEQALGVANLYFSERGPKDLDQLAVSERAAFLRRHVVSDESALTHDDGRLPMKVNIESFEDTVITGTIDAPTESVFVISVPYSRSWKLRVNEQETPTFEAQLALTGARLSPGKKLFRLTYEPYSVYVGMLVSIFSSLFLILSQLLRLVSRNW